MAYQKIGFKNGNVLTAEQLIHMEDGIIDAGKKAQSGGGASLPSAAPYQQLVTDGEGKWVAEERLAWKEEGIVEIFPQRTLRFTGNAAGQYIASTEAPENFDFVVGEKYTVVWDGIEYKDLVAFEDYGQANVGSSVENITDELPFVVAVFDGMLSVLTTSTAETHTISIFGLGEVARPIPAEYLPTTFVPTAVIKASNYDNALAGVATVKEESVTYECVNMTFEEAYKHVANGGAIMVVTMYVQAEAGLPIIERAQTIINVTAFEGEPALSAGTDNLPLLWKESGITLADV